MFCKFDKKRMVTLHKGNFFKYIDIEGGKKSLKRGTFKFSVPSITNDPFECYGGLIANNQRDYFIEQLVKEDIFNNKRVKKLKKIVNENILNNAIKELVYDQTPDQMSIFNKVRDIFSIASFSRKNDIHLMWSHYAQNHQGVCIGYEMANSKFYKNIFLLKIDYKRRVTPISFNPQKLDITLLDWITTKSYDWELEKEVRLVDLNIKRNKGKVVFKQYERKILKKITFGINTPLKEINSIIRIVKKNYPNQQVIFTKMEVGDKQFTLKEVPFISTPKSTAMKNFILLHKPKLPFIFLYCRLYVSRKISIFLDKVIVFLRRLSQDK